MPTLAYIVDWFRALLGLPDSWLCRHCGGQLVVEEGRERDRRICSECGRAHDEVSAPARRGR